MTVSQSAVALQNAFWRRAEQLLLHHTNPWELDEALTDWGYGMGPCQAQDLAGLNTVLARQTKCPGPILPRMVAEGRMGKQGGVGYYRYPGGGGAVIDPLIEDLIREEAWFAKITRAERHAENLVSDMNNALATAGRALGLSGSWAAHLSHAVHFPSHRAAILSQ